MLALQLIQCVPHQDVVFNPVHTATYRVPGKMCHDAHGALISSGDTEVTVGTVPWKVRTDRIRLPAWFTRAGQGVGTKHSCHTQPQPCIRTGALVRYGSIDSGWGA